MAALEKYGCIRRMAASERENGRGMAALEREHGRVQLN